MNILSIISLMMEKIEKAVFLFAKIGVFTMMFIITLNAISRYLFNNPITGVYEFTEKYLMVLVIFLSISYVFKLDGHIRVDVLYMRLSEKVKKILDTIYVFLGAILMFFISYLGLVYSYDALVNDKIMSGIIAWPMWLSYIWIPIGGFVFTLRLLLTFTENIITQVTIRKN